MSYTLMIFTVGVSLFGQATEPVIAWIHNLPTEQACKTAKQAAEAANDSRIRITASCIPRGQEPAQAGGGSEAPHQN